MKSYILLLNYIFNIHLIQVRSLYHHVSPQYS